MTVLRQMHYFHGDRDLMDDCWNPEKTKRNMETLVLQANCEEDCAKHVLRMTLMDKKTEETSGEMPIQDSFDASDALDEIAI